MIDNALIEKITKEVIATLSAQSGATQTIPPIGTTMINDAFKSEGYSVAHRVLLPADLAPYIDHTLLKADATEVQVVKLCNEAVEHHFFSVCVNGSRVALCNRLLQGSGVKIAAVVGFPLGAMLGRAKNFEARMAIDDGANEIDMVMNIGAMKSRDLKTVEEDILWVRRACTGSVLLKVIFETALLTDEEKVLACQIAKGAGADFVKTSTGFSTAGATVHDVVLMRRTVGPKLGVKAAGGIRNFADAVAMIEAGATRLGVSASLKIISGETSGSNY